MHQHATGLTRRRTPGGPRHRRGPGRGPIAAAAALAATLVGVFGVGAVPAGAAVGVDVDPTTTTTVAANARTSLSGLAVSGAADSDTIAVTLATTRGQVAIDALSAGVDLAYGNGNQGESVSFTGTRAQVNAALASAAFVANGVTGTASVSLSAYVEVPGYVFSATTGHFYEYVSAPDIRWDAALADAAGRQFLGETGYLVSITSAAENELVTSRIPGADNVWIGARTVAGDAPREWQWAAGPEQGQVFDVCSNPDGTCDFAQRPGYSHWADSEPNNYDGGETVAVTNWQVDPELGNAGQWNDLAVDAPGAGGYVVEYGGYGSIGGLASISSTVTIVDGPTAPSAPRGVTATPGVGTIVVSFTAPSDIGGSAITSYTVTGSTDAPGASPADVALTCIASPCTFSNLAAHAEYTFVVTATNGIGTGPASVRSDPTQLGAAPRRPSYEGGTPRLNQAFVSDFASSGYPTPTLSVVAGSLPPGLTLAPTGRISGTPTVAGAYTFTIASINSLGSESRAFTMVVGGAPDLSGSLGDLSWGTPVTVALTSSGYPAPTFAVTAGALPEGLALDTATGAITGTPTAAGLYAAEVTATNASGSASVPLSGTVRAVSPNEPTGLTVANGDGRATLTFQAPSFGGGAAISGYQVWVGDGPWTDLTTVTDGATVSGAITGLTNGTEVQVRVRAVNAAGNGEPSARVTVHPVASPPSPVAPPTAVPGVASVTVSWAASTAPGVTGYTVAAEPGPATCEATATQTSCVIGAQAGVPVRFSVVVHSSSGDSAASWTSAAVTPSAPTVLPAAPTEAPTTLTTDKGAISTVAAGETVVVVGTGFAQYSTATVVIYSSPRVLGTVQTDGEGSFRVPVQVPRNLESGQHTFVAYGVDPAGAEHAMRLPVVLPVDRTALAQTGVETRDLAAVGALLVSLGLALRVVGTRARRRAGARA